ncbi:phosphoribosyltransferase family protein [Microbacterium sp. X-17]|uniref:phosphoribosyltransferase n=1 Tax=Microbacterium sp. X-17 TaxID=3144404 RepID=UPI0031F528E8
MFADREDAGRRLGAHLRDVGITASVVLGLPRGGVPVAAAVAAVLNLPLDVIIVRKLGLPTYPEVAMGSIGEGDVRLLDLTLIGEVGVTLAELAAVERRERETLERRAVTLRGGRPRRDLTGQTVLIVDDGIATGATASAACLVARRLGAAHVIVAAPVGGPDAGVRVSGADRVVCLEQPAGFQAVGAFYRVFDQTTEDEVVRLLSESRERP